MKDCYIVGLAADGVAASTINNRVISALSCHPEARLCVGTYKGIPESSVMITNVSCTDPRKQYVTMGLRNTARQFQQESVFVVHDKIAYLVYADGVVYQELGRVVTSKYPAPEGVDFTYNPVEQEYYFVI